MEDNVRRVHLSRNYFLFGCTALAVNPIHAQSNSAANTTSASSGETNSKDLAAEMKKLGGSNNPTDIATFAYVYGFPLINNMRTIDESTDPAHYNESEANGPWNEFHYRTKLANASFTQLVAPNVDTIYSNLYFNLEKQPVVTSVPESFAFTCLIHSLAYFLNPSNILSRIFILALTCILVIVITEDEKLKDLCSSNTKI